MNRRPTAPIFSTLEILETRAMLSASAHSTTEALHHSGSSVHVELEHANKSETQSGKFRVKSDDPANHDANDDKGVDRAGHDANDNHGVDAVELHSGKGRGK